MIKLFLLLFPIICSASWEHESELGIILISGNTVLQTENAKHESTVNWDKNLIKFKSNFLHSSSEKNINIWGASLRFERGYFLETKWLGDTSAGYKYRSIIDAGIKINMNEVGYRFQYEKSIFGNVKRSHFLRIYTEFGNKKVKLWVEILPNILEIKNLQINIEPSVNISLTDLLSLKIAYLYKFNNVPAINGIKRIDTIYTTTLVASY